MGENHLAFRVKFSSFSLPHGKLWEKKEKRPQPKLLIGYPPKGIVYTTVFKQGKLASTGLQSLTLCLIIFISDL